METVNSLIEHFVECIILHIFKQPFFAFFKFGITDGENTTGLDYGDVLLKDGKVNRESMTHSRRTQGT